MGVLAVRLGAAVPRFYYRRMRLPCTLPRLPWLVLLALLGGLVAPADPAAAASDGDGPERTAWLLTIDGAIGPASADYFRRGLEGAREAGAAAVILQMDTPGGLDSSMREIIRAILASPIPVLTYVAPGGARAASAGTYILYASHVAAMAPGTNLGAATPVQLGGDGGLPLPGGGDSPGAGDETSGSDEAPARGGSASEAKALNDAIAYIRALAALHGRNQDWAEAAVREAASLSSAAALEAGVIDYVATSVNDLLQQAHGREVRIGEAMLPLDSAELQVVAHDPDWRARVLGVITNPNLALILMMVGIYGLIFEFMNPGALVPGTVGAISLLLGLYALSALPVNYVGVLLVLLGIALMVAEAFSPSFGILGLGGAASFVFGAMLLFDETSPGYRLSMSLVAGLALVSLAVTLLIVRMALKTRRLRAVTGQQALLDAVGEVLEWQQGRGRVFAAGERWLARGPATLAPGQAVRIISVQGLQVDVQSLDPVDTPPRSDT